MIGSTKEGEMEGTLDILSEILILRKDNPYQAIADIIFMIRASGRISDKELKYLQEKAEKRVK